MPAIPQYQQQTRLSGGLPTAQPNMQAMGGGSPIGNGLQNIGSALQGVADKEALIVKQQQDQDARVWAGQTTADLYSKQFTALTEAQAKAGAGAPNFTPTFLKGFDDQTEAVLTMAPNEESRRYLQAHVMSMRSSLAQHAMTFEAGAIRSDRINRHADAIDGWAKVVLQDPGQFSNALTVLGQTRPDVGPDASEKLTDTARKALTSAAAATVLDRDPYQLQDATAKAMGYKGHTGPTGVPWVDAATADQVKHWNDQATVRINQIENERARNSAAADKDAQDAVKEAFDLTLSGRYFSPEYQAALTARTRGTQFEAQANDLISDQAKVAGFASAPAGSRQATLTAMAAQGADPTKGTDPQSEKARGHLAKIDDAIKSAVKENPWQAAPSYGVRGIDAQAVTMTTPTDALALVQRRAGQIGALEQWTGKAESPMQPQEAEQFARLVRTMPLDQQAAILGQVGATVGSPSRIAALAGQLGKSDAPIELAMLSAADKTTAGRYAGELILRGDQAIRDKTIKRDDTALTGWQSEIAGLVNGTLGNPEDEARVKRAAYLVRAAMDDGSAAAPGYDLKADNAKAVAMVAGFPLERGGMKTLLPRGMKEADFDAALQKFTPEVLAGMSPTGKLYVGGKEVQPIYLANRITSLPIVRFGGGFAPLNNGRPFYLDAAGTQPLVLKVAP